MAERFTNEHLFEGAQRGASLKWCSCASSCERLYGLECRQHTDQHWAIPPDIAVPALIIALRTATANFPPVYSDDHVALVAEAIWNAAHVRNSMTYSFETARQISLERMVQMVDDAFRIARAVLDALTAADDDEDETCQRCGQPKHPMIGSDCSRGPLGLD